MSISNNILAAFMAGVSTKHLLDVLDDVDAIDGMDKLRNEFCENIDGWKEFKDYNINIK